MRPTICRCRCIYVCMHVVRAYDRNGRSYTDENTQAPPSHHHDHHHTNPPNQPPPPFPKKLQDEPAAGLFVPVKIGLTKEAELLNGRLAMVRVVGMWRGRGRGCVHMSRSKYPTKSPIHPPHKIPTITARADGARRHVRRHRPGPAHGHRPGPRRAAAQGLKASTPKSNGFIHPSSAFPLSGSQRFDAAPPCRACISDWARPLTGMVRG